jgi:hypothetical protein
MNDVEHVYEDRWGEIIDRRATELVELRWYDTTAAMSAEQFQDWLATFAGHVERLRRPRVLVDGTRFMMDPANLNDAWRDANIIPRTTPPASGASHSYSPTGCPRSAHLRPPRDPRPSRPATSHGGRRRSTGSPADRGTPGQDGHVAEAIRRKC